MLQLSIRQHLHASTAVCARRYIYSFKGPPSAEALTAVKAVLQAAILLVSSMVLSGGRREKQLRSETIPDPTQGGGATVSRSLCPSLCCG